jgi:hypothetical protein
MVRWRGGGLPVPNHHNHCAQSLRSLNLIARSERRVLPPDHDGHPPLYHQGQERGTHVSFDRSASDGLGV